MVKHKNSLLRFTRGKITSIGEYVYGQYSIGFGGHVEGTDWNLFSMADSGYSESIARELHEEIGINLSDFASHNLRTVGVLNDDSTPLGRCHFAFIHLLQVPTERFEKGIDFDKGEKSVNELKLVDIPSIADEFAGYEYWSKLCIQTYFGAQLAIDCHIHPKPGFALKGQPDVILIVGYIGSGKTEACSLLEREFGYTLVPCSRVMQRIIGCGPIEEIGRRRLQEIGYEFINQDDGHERLARGIVDYMNASEGTHFVLDGLRYPETLEPLRDLLDTPVTVIYIEATIDNLYQYYRAREAKNYSFTKFLSIMNHPVERAIERFLPKADIAIYNHGPKGSYIRVLRDSVDRKRDSHSLPKELWGV